MVAAILFMTFFGFNDEGSHSVLVFVSVCGGGSHSAPDLVQNGYPLPPTLISRGIGYPDKMLYTVDCMKICIYNLYIYIIYTQYVDL